MYGHPLAGLLWERQFEKVLLKHGWAKVLGWECLFVHRQKGSSYLCMWMLSNGVERNKTLIGCGKYSTKMSNSENQHSLIISTRDVVKDNVKHAKILLTFSEPCSNPEFPQEQWKNFHARKQRTFLHGPAILKVMPRSVWNERANFANITTEQLLQGIMTTNSTKKN